MKKITLITSFLLITILLHAQALKQGNIFINPGVEFGIEHTKTNISNNSIGGALPGLLNLTAGYMISGKFALQLRFERNGYITDPKDSLTAVTSNLLIGANYNFINSSIYAMHIGFMLEGSKLEFTPSNEQDAKNNV
jgi:hypothetical protein